MPFPLCSSPIDVLSLLHSLAFVLHISRILLRHQSLARPWAPSITSPMKPNLRFLVAARLYRHGHSQYNRYPDTPRLPLHSHPPSLLIRLSIRALHSACFIYSSRSTVQLPVCCQYSGATTRGQGPPDYLALSLCTSFDIDVLLAFD